MQLEFAIRQKAKIKMALQGPPLGQGVIDTENGSSNLYAHLRAFKVMALDAAFTPEKYMQAFSICIKQHLIFFL